MRLVRTSELTDGTELARDVLVGRSDGVPLLRAGIRITPRFRDGLIKAGVNAVYIADELSDGITPEPLVSSTTRAEATRAVARACAHSTAPRRGSRQTMSSSCWRSTRTNNCPPSGKGGPRK